MEHYSSKVDKDWQCGLRRKGDVASLRRGLEWRVKEERSMRRTTQMRHTRESRAQRSVVKVFTHRLQCMQAAAYIRAASFRKNRAQPSAPSPPPPLVIPTSSSPLPPEASDPPSPESDHPIPKEGSREDHFRTLYETSAACEAALRREVASLEDVVAALHSRCAQLEKRCGEEGDRANAAESNQVAAEERSEGLQTELTELQQQWNEAAKSRAAELLQHQDDVAYVKSQLAGQGGGGGGHIPSPAQYDLRQTACTSTDPTDVEVERTTRGVRSFAPTPPQSGTATPLSRQQMFFRGEEGEGGGVRQRRARSAQKMRASTAYSMRRGTRRGVPPAGLVVNALESASLTPTPSLRPWSVASHS